MAESFCSKSCGDCAYRRELSCPGCALGPGKKDTGDCPVARCCRSSRRESCLSCPAQSRCTTLQTVDRIFRQKEALAAREAFLARGSFLRKMIWVLFALSIPDGIAALVSSDLGLWLAPSLYGHGAFLSILIRFTMGILLLVMGAEESRYRTAGGFILVAAFINIGPHFLLDMTSAMFMLSGEYFLFTAHESVMAERSERLSLQWDVLWKWRILTYVDTIGAVVMGAVSGLPGMFSALVYSAYLAAIALAYILILNQVLEKYRDTDEDSPTVVIFMKSMPIRLINMNYFGITLVVVLLLALGLLSYMTALIHVITVILTPVLLYRTAKALPKETES